MSGRAAWGAGARMVSIRRRALDLSGLFDAESGVSNVCPHVASRKPSGQRPEDCNGSSIPLGARNRDGHFHDRLFWTSRGV